VKDPLVLTAKFARLPEKVRREDMDSDWYTRDRELSLCDDGPGKWFELPRNCKRFWAVVSPYPDDEHSYLIENNWFVEIYNPSNRSDSTNFYDGVADWIKRHILKYPQFNFYFSIEVIDE
jgi:hypothetical protein